MVTNPSPNTYLTVRNRQRSEIFSYPKPENSCAEGGMTESSYCRESALPLYGESQPIPTELNFDMIAAGSY